MLDYLKTRLADHLQQIDFINHVELSDIPLWLSRADICVFPSIWENFPNVCLEAMSAGRGIIASLQGGMKDMLEDINGGILVDINNIDSLTRSIIYLLNNPDERKLQAERCRRKIISYYASEIPEQHVNFYQRIIDDK